MQARDLVVLSFFYGLLVALALLSSGSRVNVTYNTMLCQGPTALVICDPFLCDNHTCCELNFTPSYCEKFTRKPVGVQP